MIRGCRKIRAKQNGEEIFDIRFTIYKRSNARVALGTARAYHGLAIRHPQSAIFVASCSPACDLTGMRIIAAASNPKAPQMAKYAA